MTKPDLDSAYALSSLEDTKRMYADWAETYDQSFVADHGFIAPNHVADQFAQAGGIGPILDFGAGTGVLGVALAQRGAGPIDALDVSPDMLAVAARKNVFRRLVEGNLLGDLKLEAVYNGVVSSGTFTHGHVGPDALVVLLSVAKPGAQFALSINKKHFEAQDFNRAFDQLNDKITDLHLPEVRFYSDDATGPHKDDTGYIALFRKA